MKLGVRQVAVVALLVSLFYLGGVKSVTRMAQAQEGSSTYVPAEHLLISEVFYDTPGTDSQEEWVEIYNPASQAIDLSDYKLGDEETKGGTEGMYAFPKSSQIAAQRKITVAVDGEGFHSLYGKHPDFEIMDSNPSVPNLTKHGSWSGGNFALSNSGDEILLLDKNDAPVDVVVYEAGSYGGVIAHPGISTGHSLQRQPQGKDTDDCSQDFTDKISPEPETGGVAQADIMPPTVTILSPQDGATLAGSLDVSVQAEDNERVSKVEFYIDDERVSTDVEQPYSYTWDTSSVVNGMHEIKVVAKDSSENEASQQITVNLQRPPIAILFPQLGSTLTGWVTFQAKASFDLDEPQVHFVYFLYRLAGSRRWKSLGCAWKQEQNLYSKTVNTSLIPNGSYEVKAGLVGRNSWGCYSRRYSVPVNYVIDNPLNILAFTAHPSSYSSPFGRGARISYQLSGTAPAWIEAYDCKGSLIRTIQDGLVKLGGRKHYAFWDGKDDYGNDVSEGGYGIKITALDGSKRVEKEIRVKIKSYPSILSHQRMVEFYRVKRPFSPTSLTVSRSLDCLYYESAGYYIPVRQCITRGIEEPIELGHRILN